MPLRDRFFLAILRCHSLCKLPSEAKRCGTGFLHATQSFVTSLVSSGFELLHTPSL